MDVDLRPLHRALNQLRYTTPLFTTTSFGTEDPHYVARPDNLGEQILNRVMVPGTRRLLVGGPAGCGKSTELLRIQNLGMTDYAAIMCPCDKDLDLYKLDQLTLIRYLLLRLLTVGLALRPQLTLTAEIKRDAFLSIGAYEGVLPNPREFFSGSPSRLPETTRLMGTFSRLISEIERGFLPVLLLVDGLEKVPPHFRQEELGSFVRSTILDGCQTVIVVPIWMLYGRESMEFYPDVEVLRITVDENPAFVHDVVARRADVFEPDALDAVASYSGGLPRDALQIARQACRAAMDDRSSARVTRVHVDRAAETIRESFAAMLSDDPGRATAFLEAVHRTGQLPGDPELRNLMLGHGIVLSTSGGVFRVHPVMASTLTK